MAFDNFTFYAEDGLTGERSSDNATMTLTVLPMNDPPLARNFKQYVSAGVSTVIYLNGSDVDNNLNFKTAYITK